MKKKHIAFLLLAIGAALILLSIILLIIETGNKDIIGGADLPTSIFVISHDKSGMYSKLSFLGVVIIIIAIVIGIVKKRK